MSFQMFNMETLKVLNYLFEGIILVKYMIFHILCGKHPANQSMSKSSTDGSKNKSTYILFV